jgi:cbb3-type cytochrome oxidase maturation protein
MSVIILLIIFSLLLAVGFLIAFIWSVKSNQMEDDYTPSVRILFENDIIEKQDKQEHTTKDK